MAYSPDGEIIASGARDRTLRLWHASTGEHLTTLFVPDVWVETVAFSSDGKIVACAGDKASIYIYDVMTGEHIKTLTGHSGYINSVTFAPDGRTLASASHDDTIRLWDINTGALLKNSIIKVLLQQSPIHQTGKPASGSSMQVGFWEAQRELLKPSGHTSRILAMTYTVDGDKLVCGVGSKLLLWNVPDGKLLRTITGHRTYFYSVASSPDGETIISGGMKASSTLKVHLWDVQSGRFMGSFTDGMSQAWSLDLSPDGGTLVPGTATVPSGYGDTNWRTITCWVIC